ncbi:MAG: glycosyltransferase family 9 protein [Cyclobacteriaceae bacterium]
MQRILIIQTAYIGDVILSTALAEKLHQQYPQATVDYVVRKGVKSVLETAPYIDRIIEWDKSRGKYSALNQVIRAVREHTYDLSINLQRYASSGLISFLARANEKRGYTKNPLSFHYNEKFGHTIGDGTHEVDRNHRIITSLTDPQAARPKIYFSDQDQQTVKPLSEGQYITIAPTSVWFTKQFPQNRWVEFLNQLTFDGDVFLIGGPNDAQFCQEIIEQSSCDRMTNLCGKLGLRESALLMRDASMNYMNDSGPLHLASAVNAPTTAVFCSTVPRFGFGPLADNAVVVETEQHLDCRPCGLHGHKACPKGHFDCANTIEIKQLLDRASE